MKKLLYLLTLTLFVFTSCEQEEIIDVSTDTSIVNKKAPKVTICHYDADNDTWKTITVNENALKAHLDHGDQLGSCSERRTYLDGGIEHFLIECGYDDIYDGSVLTSKINTITQMHLPFDGGGGAIDGSSCFSPWEVSTLTGIQDFVALEDFSFGGTLETNLDFSSLIKLKKLRIDRASYLSNLDLSKNTALTDLSIEPTNTLASINAVAVPKKYISTNVKPWRFRKPNT